jgi:endoglycosylceramidase
MFNLLTASVLAQADLKIDTTNRVFRDKAGRHLMLHGVNAVYKIAPYVPSVGNFTPDTSLDDRDIQDLKDWGINQVRLGVMWEAVEPTEDFYNQYNDTYLDEVETLINKMGEAGIYTLVDAHQDVLARVICGEGMPDFYAKQVLQNEH